MDPEAIAVIKRMWRQENAETRPYNVKVEAEWYRVLPRVFSPKYRGNSRYFILKVPPYVTGSYLGIGAGAGILEVRLAKTGVSVVATDLFMDPCMNCKINARLHGVTMDIRSGHLFEPIGETRFDTIFWNHPWVKSEDYLEHPRLKVSFDYGYQDLERFFAKVPDHLKPGGSLLLGTGSLADLIAIGEMAARHGLHSELLCRATIPLEVRGKFKVEAMLYRFRLA